MNTNCRGAKKRADATWPRLDRVSMRLAASALALAIAGALSPSARAIDDNGASFRCVYELQQGATLTSSSASLVLGQSTQIAWSVVLPAACAGDAKISIVGVADVQRELPLSGSLRVSPLDTTSYALVAAKGGLSRTIASVRVNVDPPRNAAGKIDLTITSSNQAALFIKAISSEDDFSKGATVHIADGVALDLTPFNNVQVKPGVSILGNRSPKNPGPLLYSDRAEDGFQFIIGDDVEPGDFRLPGDDVTIRGIRLRGPKQGVVSFPDPRPVTSGIKVASSVNVELSNNEMFGWPKSAIKVVDPYGRIDRANGAGAVRVLNNYLHHNQDNEEGYGVEVKEDAYVLVEGNHFEYNRHAMAAGGTSGTGYFFRKNFIGDTGGDNYWNWSHQVDMHGTGSNGFGGTAGEYMDISHNAIAYTKGNAIKLRGEPAVGMFVSANAFRHDDPWGGDVEDGAMYQSNGTGGIIQWGNTFDARDQPSLPSTCDFDGDGEQEYLLTTGAIWLTAKGAFQPNFLPGSPPHLPYDPSTRYLNTSSLPMSALVFEDVNHDGKCDVRVVADGRVSLGGTSPLARGRRVDAVVSAPGSESVQITNVTNGVVGQAATVPTPNGFHVVGAGDLDADGDDDVLLQSDRTVAVGEPPVPAQPLQRLFLQNGQLVRREASLGPANARLAAFADFNADGYGDTLWQGPGGLELVLTNVLSTSPLSMRVFRGNRSDWTVPTDTEIKAVGDFNGDGYPDLAWRRTSGEICIWRMVGGTYVSEECTTANRRDLAEWSIQGAGDFDGDGASDLLLRHADGRVELWFKGSAVAPESVSRQNAGVPTPASWKIQAIVDLNSDGKADLVWRNGTGEVAFWFMDGARYVSESASQSIPGAAQFEAVARTTTP